MHRFQNFIIFFKIHLLGMQIYREGTQRNKDLPPTGLAPNDCNLHCLPRHASGELNWKWSGWAFGQHPYGMLALHYAQCLPTQPGLHPHGGTGATQLCARGRGMDPPFLGHAHTSRMIYPSPQHCHTRWTLSHHDTHAHPSPGCGAQGDSALTFCSSDRVLHRLTSSWPA